MSEDKRAAFLAALGPDGAPDLAGAASLDSLLLQELDELAHPRARAAARGQQPVDTLVQFLVSAGRISQRIYRLGELSTWLVRFPTSPGTGQSPRTAVVQQIETVLGRPAQELAGLLGQLIEEAVHSTRAIDYAATKSLYFETHQLAGLWDLALDEEMSHSPSRPRSGQADELYAVEAATWTLTDASEPFAERLDTAERIRELAELLSLDRWGLVDWRHWGNRLPSLGWPATLAQALYRLRRLTPPTGEGESLLTPVAAPPMEHGDRFGRALHLLDAYQGDLSSLTADQPGVGLTRMRRSGNAGMYLTTLQILDLLHELDTHPAADLPADRHREALVLLRDHLVPLFDTAAQRPAWLSTPTPDAAELPLNSWEMRERFPETLELLRLHHEAVARGEYGGNRDQYELIGKVCETYVELRGRSGRHLSALVAEIAAAGALFPTDEQLDRALGHLGASPRDEDPALPWWDELTWGSWLREVSADLMHRAGR